MPGDPTKMLAKLVNYPSEETAHAKDKSPGYTTRERIAESPDLLTGEARSRST